MSYDSRERAYIRDLGRHLAQKSVETLAGSPTTGTKTIALEEAKKILDARQDEPRVKRALDSMVAAGALVKGAGMGKYVTTTQFGKWWQSFKETL